MRRPFILAFGIALLLTACTPEEPVKKKSSSEEIYSSLTISDSSISSVSSNTIKSGSMSFPKV